jgi:ABC-2 type transport system permease protein
MISLARTRAVFVKETVQMRRDRLTFAIMIMVPVMQLALFGFAINTDPRHLKAAVELRDDGPLTRSLLAGFRQSSYVDVVRIVDSAEEGDRLLRSGRISYFIVVPEDFEADLVRGARPQILVAADASDPVAASGAVGAFGAIAERALRADLERLPRRLAPGAPPYEIVVHRRYNPAGVTAYNIVPGLLGVILTMTMIMITSIALTRETERGTIETLLATPVRPLELMIGKTTPYVIVGAIQTAIVLVAARFVFDIPFEGSPLALLVGVALFILTNLMVGYLISTVARTQMQAMQMTFFIFLPSLLLSGFMFPFAAMPAWARAIGDAMPITHFLRIVREVILKGAGLADVAGDLLPMAAILLVVAAAALARFRRTLD